MLHYHCSTFYLYLFTNAFHYFKKLIRATLIYSYISFFIISILPVKINNPQKLDSHLFADNNHHLQDAKPLLRRKTQK